MHYTIYKITNKVNGKSYIGKHQTKILDDDYMGSGKLITRAVKKHGKENFDKELLFIFDNEEDMNSKEAELVTEKHCSEDLNYNLCPGGQGGWGYVNSNGLTNKNKDYTKIGKALKGKPRPDVSLQMKERHRLGLVKYDTFSGKTHSEETKVKLRKSKNVGSDNSQYGSIWINNGIVTKKIKGNIPDGWYRGRKLCSVF